MRGFSQLFLAGSISAFLIFQAGYSAAEDRSITGAGNNLNILSQGAARTPMIRHGYGSEFGPGNALVADSIRGNARDISNAIFSQSKSIRSARGLSDYLWAWGQFVGHDMDLVTDSNGVDVNGSAPIAINDPYDPLGPGPIPFTRANAQLTTGGRGGSVLNVVNEVTSYIDASQIYGSSEERASALRTAGGKLLTGDHNLLPRNTMGVEMENRSPLPSTEMFIAGDIRANENPLLTSLQTVFMREHNRLVDLIAAQQPDSTDEQRFQLARKLVGAEVQIVTYREFLPALLGDLPNTPKAEQYQYSAGVNASITNAFAHAAYRFGHSAVSPTMKLVDEQGATVGELPLREAFFNPALLADDPALLDELLRGAARQKSQEIDTLVIDDLRNFLFGPPGAGGMDLAAINIQRGRDAGLPNYLSLRKSHQVSPSINTFGQITSDADLAALLAGMAGNNLNNIDPWVGMLSEDHVAGASIGPTAWAIIASQFQRLRDGDRLFYRGAAAGLYNGNGVLDPAIAAIIDLDSLQLSDILAWNTGVDRLQANIFFAVPEPSCYLLVAVALGMAIAAVRR